MPLNCQLVSTLEQSDNTLGVLILFSTNHCRKSGFAITKLVLQTAKTLGLWDENITITRPLHIAQHHQSIIDGAGQVTPSQCHISTAYVVPILSSVGIAPPNVLPTLPNIFPALYSVLPAPTYVLATPLNISPALRKSHFSLTVFYQLPL